MTREGVVVAGVICLDVIPSLEATTLRSALRPGTSVEAGPIGLFTGGAVANVGRCLFRLGIRPHLVARIGDDAVGHTILRLVQEDDARLADHLTLAPGEKSPCTIVLSPPSTDRSFITYPGTNHAFGADDVPYELLGLVRVFHFGYPPYMMRMCADDGAELVDMCQRAKDTGVITTLDMAYPEPEGRSGRVDWRTVLKRVLPYVDIFLPSLDELLVMLRRDAPAPRSDRTVSDVASEIVDMGVGLVVVKLGARGLYLRSTTRTSPMLSIGWKGRELWTPCFRPDRLVGTTGSGDATVAGFLAGVLRGQSPEAALTSAVAVGACNVEAADALSGIRSWEETQGRIAEGWARASLVIDAPGWRWNRTTQCWTGAHDGQR